MADGIDRKAEERMEFTTSKDVTVAPTFQDSKNSLSLSPSGSTSRVLMISGSLCYGLFSFLVTIQSSMIIDANFSTL